MIEFTTKQLAELVGVSKPTIQKAINDLNIQPERTDNTNRGYYSHSSAVSIIKKVKPNYDISLLDTFGEKPQNETEKPQNEPQETEKPQNFSQNLESETAKPQNEQLELLRRAFSVLEAQLVEKDKQLAEKDKQIAIKDQQIQDYSKRLEEAMLLTGRQQYIAAADIKKEADSRRDQEEGQEVIINETAAAVKDNISKEDLVEHEEEPQKKKSFWQRLFGR